MNADGLKQAAAYAFDKNVEILLHPLGFSVSGRRAGLYAVRLISFEMAENANANVLIAAVNDVVADMNRPPR